MLTVIIKDDGEQKVVDLTFQNLWKELKDIPDTKLLVSTDWFSVLPDVKTNYVCFVEADCLVNSGYFSSMLGLYAKSRMLRKLAMLTSSTAVNLWVNKFYGYTIEDGDKPYVRPSREPKSRGVYPVQIGYLPGAIIRTSTLKDLLAKDNMVDRSDKNLVSLSTQISLGFWKNGDGNRVHINPNTTYVTTEDYVNDLGQFDPGVGELMEMFKRESI